MSVNHAAHIPQSLPSFAQAFSSSSLSDISPMSNALPPIQHQSHERPRPTLSPPSRDTPRNTPPDNSQSTRKRTREDVSQPARSDAVPVDSHNVDDSRQSPKAVRIKEEDRDDQQRPPQSPPQLADMSRDSSSTPGLQPSSKKRRVTVSGAPHGPNPSVEQATPIPVSPVAPSLSLPEDATVRDQSRSMLAVKQQQQQKVLEQRRGSITAVVSSTGPSPMVSGSVLSRSPPEDQLTTSKLANLPRIGRHSPNALSIANRCAGNAVASGSQATASSTRPLTPPIVIVSSQQQTALTSSQNAGEPSSKQHQGGLAHSLPPPPISFARRRAAQSGGRKKKPADILISPRGAGPSDPLAPVIQSAPPVADPDRFSMAIPRLPLVLGNAQTTRRVAGNVPPTPTRFGLQSTSAPSISSAVRTVQSPPNPSVPIANTLVPPTPHVLHHAGYTGDKSAFLAPFEIFYDALNDSKQLKNWLADQLQKSNALMLSLKQQQEKMDEIVEDLVEKRTRAMREEIVLLRQRMESLEEALLSVRAEVPAKGQDAAGYNQPQGFKLHQNGISVGPEPASPYHFPGAEQRRPDANTNVNSPGRDQEGKPSPPLPLDAPRRLSISATAQRPEPPQASLSTFALSGHNRGAPVPQGSAKGTPPSRPQSIPERSSTARQPEIRSTPRMYYPSSAEGHSSSKGGDVHRSFASGDERQHS